jgi:hypothetical protein
MESEVFIIDFAGYTDCFGWNAGTGYAMHPVLRASLSAARNASIEAKKRKLVGAPFGTRQRATGNSFDAENIAVKFVIMRKRSRQKRQIHRFRRW